VYGFGEKKTPRPFVAACDRFIYTEIFTTVEGQAPPRQPPSELDRNQRFLDLVGGAVDDATDENGWAHLGAVGSILNKKAPDFDSRNYGYSKLSDLLEASNHFELRRQDKVVSVKRAKSGS